MITAQDYIDGLHWLRNHAVDGTIQYPQMGVCGNLSRHLEETWPYEQTYTLVEELGAEWEHATFYTDTYGEEHLDAHFVPHVRGYGKWEGDNLSMRVLLIDFLIDCVQQEINRGVSVLTFD